MVESRLKKWAVLWVELAELDNCPELLRLTAELGLSLELELFVDLADWSVEVEGWFESWVEWIVDWLAEFA